MPGSRKLTIAGQKLDIMFDLNAVCELEDEFNMGFFQIAKTWIGFKFTRATLRAALLFSNPDLTPKQAGQLLQEHCDKGGTMEEVTEQLLSALKDSGIMAEQKSVDDKNPALKAISPKNDEAPEKKQRTPGATKMVETVEATG
jgi:hypothetical protein